MFSRKWLDGKLAVSGFWHPEDWRGHFSVHAWCLTVNANTAWPYASASASVNLPFPSRAEAGPEEQRA